MLVISVLYICGLTTGTSTSPRHDTGPVQEVCFGDPNLVRVLVLVFGCGAGRSHDTGAGMDHDELSFRTC